MHCRILGQHRRNSVLFVCMTVCKLRPLPQSEHTLWTHPWLWYEPSTCGNWKGDQKISHVANTLHSVNTCISHPTVGCPNPGRFTVRTGNHMTRVEAFRVNLYQAWVSVVNTVEHTEQPWMPVWSFSDHHTRVSIYVMWGLSSSFLFDICQIKNISLTEKSHSATHT